MTITAEVGAPAQYFHGDAFVLPTGFTGHWTVEGRKGVRVIDVVAQDF